MTTHRIAVIGGDGVGPEVMASAVTVLEALAARDRDLDFEVTSLDWSCRRYRTTGAVAPPDGIEGLGEHEAVLLGPLGDPRVPSRVPLWDLVVPMRRALRQYVGVRPVRGYPGVASPLRDPGTVDLVVVTETVEGESIDVGGRLHAGFPEEMAIQESVYTRVGITRAVDVAFTIAATRGGHLVSATADGVRHTHPLWDEIVAERAESFPGVDWRCDSVARLCADLATRPGDVDVVVTPDLFGGAVTELAAALAGGVALAPSAGVDPEHDHPSSFGPVHGPDHDLAGSGAADPVGAILSAAMMLDHLGHGRTAARVRDAVAGALTVRRTPDLGGVDSTHDVTDAVVDRLR